MNMDFSPQVFDQKVDESLIAEIDTLRTIRINVAERMLRELNITAQTLLDQGLIQKDDHESGALRDELEGRIQVLKSRLKEPHVVYVDEIKLYMDLLERQDQEDEELLQ